MSRVRAETLSRIEMRVCLRCGYSGSELQRGSAVEAFVCPGCGEDLYARPARSYAEMEGFATPRRGSLILGTIAAEEPLDPVRAPRRRGLLWWSGRLLGWVLGRRRG